VDRLKHTWSGFASTTVENRDVTKEEAKEFDLFANSIKKIDATAFQRKGIYDGKHQDFIKRYLHEGVNLNSVILIKLNNDDLEDFLILYSFPVDTEESAESGALWQTGLAIILSESNGYLLQYDDPGFAHDTFKIITDIQIVNFYGKNKQILIGHLNRGQFLQSGFSILWFD
jgi:hypothetical protein